MENTPDVIRKDIWLAILKKLAERPYEKIANKDFLRPDGVTCYEFDSNLRYITDYGLCKICFLKDLSKKLHFDGVVITSRGIDYLREDKGLSGELDIVTVRLDADTIRALICNQVDMAEGSEPEKNTLKHLVRTMSGEALKSLTGELVKAGLKNTPDLLHWLGAVSHF